MEGSTSIALASRFAGLDVVDLLRLSIHGAAGIKCVNWLTMVEDAFLDKLGGRSAVARRFGPEIVCHEIPNGLVIQAGPRPVVGDQNRPDQLTHYREVAAVLKPIYGPARLLDGLWDRTRDVTVAWRNRFFEGARWP
jgi:hypothetical protein